MQRPSLPQISRLLLRSVALLAIAGHGPQAVAEIRDLPVPSVTIYPNDIISGSLLIERRFRVTSTSVVGFATNRASIIGMQSRRRLSAGKPIPLAALGIPVAVRRGATVSASYSELGFSISASLIALQDGAAGDVIDARNTSSGVLVRALVRPDGTLQVGGE